LVWTVLSPWICGTLGQIAANEARSTVSLQRIVHHEGPDMRAAHVGYEAQRDRACIANAGVEGTRGALRSAFRTCTLVTRPSRVMWWLARREGGRSMSFDRTMGYPGERSDLFLTLVDGVTTNYGYLVIGPYGPEHTGPNTTAAAPTADAPPQRLRH